MSAKPATHDMALFCDFENVAPGVEDAALAAPDIQKVLERRLLKGNIVVKKADCERDQKFQADMPEAAFELTDIPHLRQSGKNSADIRMVVEASDLCSTRSHHDTFVIISGDSVFSPLVSKPRENSRLAIGVGLRKSTSDLPIADGDQSVSDGDPVREDEQQRKARRKTAARKAANRKKDLRKPSSANAEDERKPQAVLDLVLETVEDLFEERGEQDKVWNSMIKPALTLPRPRRTAGPR